MNFLCFRCKGAAHDAHVSYEGNPMNAHIVTCIPELKISHGVCHLVDASMEPQLQAGQHNYECTGCPFISHPDHSEARKCQTKH